jgi:hypothetical protein
MTDKPYIILESWDSQELVKEVNEYIGKGYDPVGGMSVKTETSSRIIDSISCEYGPDSYADIGKQRISSNTTYSQAMYKKAKK